MFFVVVRRLYALSDSGDAHLQMSCISSSGQPASYNAQASADLNECHEKTDAATGPIRAASTARSAW